MRNANETNSEKIEKMINMGEYVVKELEALYSLRKYRAMKRRYYDQELEWMTNTIYIYKCNNKYNIYCMYYKKFTSGYV